MVSLRRGGAESKGSKGKGFCASDMSGTKRAGPGQLRNTATKERGVKELLDA